MALAGISGKSLHHPSGGLQCHRCRSHLHYLWKASERVTGVFSPWAFCAFWGVLSARPYACRSARHVRLRKRICVTAVGNAFLLVDGDQHIRLEDDMTNAVASLHQEGWSVNITVFGALSQQTRNRLLRFPKLRQDRKIESFKIQHVPRIGNAEGQPNDEAIFHEVCKLSKEQGPQCIALLVSDGDFAVAVEHALSRGRELVVFVPHLKPGVETVFNSTGARVVKLPPYNNYTIKDCKVQAVLTADGTGFVKTGPPMTAQHMESTSLRDFLSHFGYCSADSRPDMLCSAMTKFWFAHQLGDSFTVYPYRTAVLDFKKMLVEYYGQRWEAYQHNLAFFLPTRGARRPGVEAKQRYGGGFATSIYQGGGPFILQDSEDLVSSALQKLGFLDSGLNSNLAEAMLVFCNVSNNKGALLRMKMLPRSSVSSATEKLRQAYLSSSTGMWEGPPSDAQVRRLLSQERLIAGSPSKEVLCTVMKSYVQNRGLPEMSTYHGLVWRILQSLDKNPARREIIEFC